MFFLFGAREWQGHGAQPASPTALESPAVWGLECGPLSLHLLLEFLDETPVGALGDELLRAVLEHLSLVQRDVSKRMVSSGSYSRHLAYGSSFIIWRA